MSLPLSTSENSPLITPQFIEQVRQCLDHLYDLPFLLSNPLTFPESDIPVSGKNLKIELMRKIEGLNPGPNFSMPSREARPYHVLHLHYIQKMGVEEIASILNISVRQAYRDLRAGEEKLAALIWESHHEGLDTQPTNGTDTSLNGEISRMPSNVHSFNLLPILQNGCQVTRELAYQRQTYVHLQSFPETVPVTAEPALAQQLIVSLLSYTVRQVTPGTNIEVSYKPYPASIIFQYSPDPQLTAQHAVSDLVYQLADRLNWTFSISEPAGIQTLRIDLNQKPKTILLIEDNEGVIELFRRYLTDQPVQVISSPDSPKGLQLASELQPDLIILDVMMQDLDGWEVLRQLKASTQTVRIPAIVCSVFFEPDLAMSLGAAAFLPKPVTLSNLQKTLQDISFF